MPHLYIIAGPNGSGKSLFSKDLVTVDYTVFDGDKYISTLKKQFPETGSDTLEKFVNDNPFKEAKEKAIADHKSFAFETNFSAEDPLASQREFKAVGYETHLLFIGLQTLEHSLERVERRVKAGGHNVSPQAIAYNFKNGYENLLKFYHAFDSVMLMENPLNEAGDVMAPKAFLRWEKNMLIAETDNIPEWMSTFVTHVQNNELSRSEEKKELIKKSSRPDDQKGLKRRR